MSLKVRAIKTGYFGGMLREAGAVFTITEQKVTDADGKERTMSVEEQFSTKWMEKVEAPPTLTVPASVIVPPATLKAPAPVMSEPTLKLCVPFSRSVAPLATAKSALCVASGFRPHLGQATLRRQ